MSNTNSLLELLTHPDTGKTAPTSGDARQHARMPLAGLEVLIRMIVQEELHRQRPPSLVDGDNAGDEHADASTDPGQERNAAQKAHSASDRLTDRATLEASLPELSESEIDASIGELRAHRLLVQEGTLLLALPVRMRLPSGAPRRAAGDPS